MRYEGVTEYWKPYIAKSYKMPNWVLYLSFFMIPCFFVFDSIGGTYSYKSTMVLSAMFIIPILLIYIPCEIIFRYLTRNETCVFVCSKLSYLTHNPDDKYKKVNAYLELKEHSFEIGGCFIGERYKFVKTEIFYKDIVDINTDFNKSFVLKCKIINELNRYETIELDIYNMYYIDNEGMQYFYDKYYQYQKKRS